MASTSKIEISRSALQHNIQFLKNHLGQNIIFSAVVKGNAYGHGIEQVVPITEESGIKHFSVFCADEAMKVHKLIKPGSKIMIMGWMTNDDINWAIRQDVEFFLYNLIGYGTTFFAQENKKIAIIPVGYSQGYSRTLSSYGRILIKGQRAPVIGNVNMNMLIADVTRIPKVARNDEVVLIGKQGGHTISVASFSEMTDMLNYETLSRLPDNIERIIVD